MNNFVFSTPLSFIFHWVPSEPPVPITKTNKSYMLELSVVETSHPHPPGIPNFDRWIGEIWNRKGHHWRCQGWPPSSCNQWNFGKNGEEKYRWDTGKGKMNGKNDSFWQFDFFHDVEGKGVLNREWEGYACLLGHPEIWRDMHFCMCPMLQNPLINWKATKNLWHISTHIQRETTIKVVEPQTKINTSVCPIGNRPLWVQVATCYIRLRYLDASTKNGDHKKMKATWHWYNWNITTWHWYNVLCVSYEYGYKWFTNRHQPLQNLKNS